MAKNKWGIPALMNPMVFTACICSPQVADPGKRTVYSIDYSQPKLEAIKTVPGMPEERQGLLPGATGMAVCTWSSGEIFESDVPNLMLAPRAKAKAVAKAKKGKPKKNTKASAKKKAKAAPKKKDSDEEESDEEEGESEEKEEESEEEEDQAEEKEKKQDNQYPLKASCN